MAWYHFYSSPIGELLLTAIPAGIRSIHFPEQLPSPWQPDGLSEDSTPFTACCQLLTRYFRGENVVFNLPLAPQGTPFQQQVWAALMEIPYGETCSYKDIAIRIGNPKAVRAVGSANRNNPLPILIPCHRVIGSNGSLTGYAGGLARKTALLKLERSVTH